MNEQVNRRAFLRGTARWGLLGGLATVTAVLALRRQTCARAGACAGCRLTARCELPPAIQFRQQTKGGPG